jgi:O-6-methylguanine DNA methyltransferase
MNVYVTRLRTKALGTLQLAGTSSGLVRVQLDDDGDGMREALRRQYPEAAFKRPSGLVVEASHVIRAYLDGGADPCDIPVVLPEVGFATRVWRQLRRIPLGQVRTYGVIARMLRRPRAARAVGQACGRNPLPLVVPCHRVLAADRKLGGFSAGLGLKRSLLRLEGVPFRE